MPAQLDDPGTVPFFRTSGLPPYPVPGGQLPLSIVPRQVTLRDRITIATVLPFSSPDQVPLSLLAYLTDQFAREIEKGDTYPMLDPLPLDKFGPYWFGVFGAIMLLGDIQSIEQVHQMARTGRDWDKECLGTFYIKPNYPGRSSHVCNGGFVVTDGARNRGVGRLMGETYLEWAPKMGYTYSVFNLVYETNVASCRIWDALGFKRIGRVKGCGSLKSYPGELVDAIIYGRDLGQDDDFVSEERFDKIRFYLKNGKYPNGADRAEKSRLRSAATHYKLIPAEGDQPEKLVLKGKEVIPDTQRQYEIARQVHLKSHGGINKTTASIAEQYHWVRIKETVSQVIRNCPECSEMNKGLLNSNTRTPARFATTGYPTTMNNTMTPRGRQGSRSPSPSHQLQMEAAQATIHQPPYPNRRSQYNHNSYEMPVDPALMDGVQQAPSLEDLPPSPFLSAGRGLPMPHSIPPLAGSNIPSSVAQMQDTNMGGTKPEERAPTAGQELRRRLAKAGFEGKK